MTNENPATPGDKELVEKLQNECNYVAKVFAHSMNEFSDPQVQLLIASFCEVMVEQAKKDIIASVKRRLTIQLVAKSAIEKKVTRLLESSKQTAKSLVQGPPR